MKAEKGKKSKKKALIIVLIVLFAAILAFILACDNKTLDVERVQLGGGETEIKIAHLSDLHFPRVDTDLDALIKTIEDENVDFIAITGDIVDLHDQIEGSGVYEFVTKLKSVAPIYYVTGNHEKRNADCAKLFAFMRENTTFLQNAATEITVKDKKIIVGGLDDNAELMDNIFSGKSNADYKILLAHRPEKADGYSSSNLSVLPDLVLAGHAHGGQFRAFDIGFFAPNQGFFPQYSDGLYQLNENVQMFVSRGIGNSGIPLRFNDLPHLPIISINI